MRTMKTICALALVILAVPMFGASYIKFDGIDGESKAAGWDKWIDLTSTSFEGGACNADSRAGAVRHVSIQMTKVPEALVQACTSQKRFPTVVVDVDGRRHTLQNVSFSQCPAPSATPTTGTRSIRLDFGSCSEHQATAGHVKVFDGASGQLIGLAPAPIDVKILKTTLRGNIATAKFVPGLYREILGRPIDPATGKVAKIDALTVKQTVTRASVTFTNAVITSFVDGPDGPTLTFEFETMTGSAADYLRLGAN